jgi:site-specific DNA-cytosine methylase
MNRKETILLDLFSGIGGFHLGLTNAGFEFTHTYYNE